MGIFKNKHDPISERARTLQSEIVALEASIKELDNQVQTGHAPAGRGSRETNAPARSPAASSGEPIFERVDQNRLQEQPQASGAHQFNDLGLRKYDLAGLIGRLRKHLYGPSVSNPRLVNYLAAGSVQGLRSLRYEKRVARNRFYAWVLLFFVIGFGILAELARRH